jgi:dihydroxyacid dehydratase/phosphogluconate dehydratase
MGTEGLKAALVKREVIADSVELAARGYLFDGLVSCGTPGLAAQQWRTPVSSPQTT